MDRILRKQRDDDGDVVLLREVARALGLKRSTAYIAARAGELPMQFVGGRYEMRRADLERLVAERNGDLTPAAREDDGERRRS